MPPEGKPTPKVVQLFIATVHRHPMKVLQEVRAVAGRGLEGCIHGRLGSGRQVLFMDLETLQELGLRPGAVQENVTMRGLRAKVLEAGQELRIGTAKFEVTGPCEPCWRMEQIRRGLQHELRGRRGVLCRVVESGLIRCGDSIHLYGALGAGG